MLQTCDIEINDVNKYNKSSGRIYTAEKRTESEENETKTVNRTIYDYFLSVGLFKEQEQSELPHPLRLQLAKLPSSAEKPLFSNVKRRFFNAYFNYERRI
ncbi:MAG: hypothetical protein ACLR56_00305 [Oscillospiraceae bacterium]